MSDKFCGICAVYAYCCHEKSKHCAELRVDLCVEPCVEPNGSTDGQMMEFSSIIKCNGYIQIVNEEYYVVTCNHLIQNDGMITIYKAYCDGQFGDNITELSLKVYAQFYELDIAIFSVINNKQTIWHYNAIVPDKICDSYVDEPSGSNIIVHCRYDNNKLEFEEHRINTDIVLGHGIINCVGIGDIPYFKFVPNKLEHLGNMNSSDCKNSNEIIASSMKGMSGGMLRNGTSNIGIILMCCIAEANIYVKSIPLLFLKLVVAQCIDKKRQKLIGINVLTTKCDIEYNKCPLVGRYVVAKTCPYKNKKKDFCFNRGDIIVKVDGVEFDDDSKLHMGELDCSVTLDTFLFLRSMINGMVCVTIIKSHTKKVVFKSYIIDGIEYDRMYKCNLTHNGLYVRWNRLLFFEMSQEILEEYNNKMIKQWNKQICEYSNQNEKYIILHDPLESPDIGLFIVDKIGNRRVNDLKQLGHILGSVKCGGTIGFTLIDGNNNSIKFQC